jgi:hypothetical protein
MTNKSESLIIDISQKQYKMACWRCLCCNCRNSNTCFFLMNIHLRWCCNFYWNMVYNYWICKKYIYFYLMLFFDFFRSSFFNLLHTCKTRSSVSNFRTFEFSNFDSFEFSKSEIFSTWFDGVREGVGVNGCGCEWIGVVVGEWVSVIVAVLMGWYL